MTMTLATAVQNQLDNDRAQYKYDAFISYRRSDGKAAASWLRHQIQGFKSPSVFPELKAVKLRVYLDTAYERGTNDFYNNTIRPALLHSRFLIVISTPDAITQRGSANDWIRNEIDDFTNGPNGEHVLVVRGGGQPTDGLPAEIASKFPNIEIVDVRGAWRGVWLNPLKSKRLRGELLKLVAPMLQIAPEEMPKLRLEELRREQVRTGMFVGIAASLLAISTSAAALALWGLSQARSALSDGIFSTERLVSVVDQTFPPDSDPYGTRGALLIEICDLMAKLEAKSKSANNLGVERIICEVERARGNVANLEIDTASQRFDDILLGYSKSYLARPNVVDALAIIRLRFSQLDVLESHLDAKNGSELKRLSTEELARFNLKFGGDREYLAEMGQLLTRRAVTARELGNAAIEKKQTASAVTHWQNAISILRSVRFSESADKQIVARNRFDSAELLVAVAAFTKQSNRANSIQARAEADHLLTSLEKELMNREIESEVIALRKKWRLLS
jgi:hypothetical protein